MKSLVQPFIEEARPIGLASEQRTRVHQAIVAAFQVRSALDDGQSSARGANRALTGFNLT